MELLFWQIVGGLAGTALMDITGSFEASRGGFNSVHIGKQRTELL